VQVESKRATAGLSTIRETATDKGVPPAGKAFLRDDALPAKDGGGIVFPNGPFGRGFYLDEWSFIRYCTAQSEADHVAAQKSSLRKDLESVAYWAALIIFGLVFVRFKEVTGVTMGQVYGTLAAVLACVYLYRFYRALYGKPQHFLSAYPEASPVPNFAQWRARILLEAAQGLRKSVWHCAYRISIPVSIVFFAWGEHGEDAMPDGIANIFYGFAIFEGLLFLVFFTCYLRIRLRLGRAPTPADLKPVSLSEA
jgi:hypothetical protein